MYGGTLTTVNGALDVTGSGGIAGIRVDLLASISATGTGDVTLMGMSSSGEGVGLPTSTVSTGSGTLTVTGTGSTGVYLGYPLMGASAH